MRDAETEAGLALRGPDPYAPTRHLVWRLSQVLWTHTDRNFTNRANGFLLWSTPLLSVGNRKITTNANPSRTTPTTLVAR